MLVGDEEDAAGCEELPGQVAETFSDIDVQGEAGAVGTGGLQPAFGGAVEPGVKSAAKVGEVGSDGAVGSIDLLDEELDLCEVEFAFAGETAVGTVPAKEDNAVGLREGGKKMLQHGKLPSGARVYLDMISR
jgi:hypothetical protein